MDILQLLHLHIGSIGPDSAIVKQNMLASRSMESDIANAIEAQVNAQQRLAEHTQFCEQIDNILEESAHE